MVEDANSLYGGGPSLYLPSCLEASFGENWGTVSTVMIALNSAVERKKLQLLKSFPMITS